MGNRAIIAFEGKGVRPVVYVHWNGGIESVMAICEVCKRRNYRSPESDSGYAFARFVGVWHEFFGIDCSTSLGVEMLDPEVKDSLEWDNGNYFIGANWRIVKHILPSGEIDDNPTVPEEETKKMNGIIEFLMDSYEKAKNA